MHHDVCFWLSNRPQVQLPAADMELCWPVLLSTEKSSRTLPSTSEAKVAVPPGTCPRSSPDRCGKVYRPVRSEVFVNYTIIRICILLLPQPRITYTIY